MKVNKGKVPALPFSKSRTCPVKKTKKCDGGRSVRVYERAMANVSPITDTVSAEPREKVVEKVVGGALSPDEFKRLRERFPVWKKRSATKISSFMNDMNPMRVYSVREMRTYCDSKGIKYAQVISYMSGASATTRGHGDILCVVNDRCYLHKELVPDFLKYFGD